MKNGREDQGAKEFSLSSGSIEEPPWEEPQAPLDEAETPARWAFLRSRRFLLAVYALAALVACLMGFAFWKKHPVAFDDSWISFRYADNLIRGRGLVYNPGEHVEGFTNFLWVLLCAVGMRLRLEPLLTARILGLGAFFGQAALVAWTFASTRKQLTRADLGLLFLPLLVVLPAGHALLAGAGLETSLFAFLVVAMVLTFHLPEAVPARLARWLRVLLPLALMMTRLDGALFIVGSVVAWTGHRLLAREGLKNTVLSTLRAYGPAGALVGLFLLFKAFYYGGILPNTYYAKAAYLNSWASGLAYLSTFSKSYLSVGMLIVLALVGTAVKRSNPYRELATAIAVSLVLFTFYLVKAGGDFMHYRFAFEAYASLVILAGIGLREIAALSPAGAASVGVVLVGVGRGAPILEKTYLMQSLDEMNGYAQHGTWIGTGLAKRLPKDTIISTTLAGTMSYFSDLEVIDELGLNDKFVAHMPFNKSSVPYRGHVKRAPESYLQKRGVNFAYQHPNVVPCQKLTTTSPSQVFTLIDKGLCARGNFLTPSPAILDYVCGHPEYFSLHGVGCPRDLVLYAPATTPPARAEDAVRLAGHWLPDAAIHFDEAVPGWKVTGTAFLDWPHELQKNQSTIVGAQGRFINTFQVGRGDAATGTLRSTPFRIEGDVIVIRVGGGNDPERLRVSLLVDGHRIHSATGQQTETLSPRIWKVSEYKGKEAVLELVDNATGAWGHLLVDELTQFQLQP